MLAGKILRITVVLLFLPCSLQMKKVLKMDRFEPCYLIKNSPVKMIVVITDFIKNVGSVLYSELEIERDFHSITMVINPAKCANRESLDSCEDYGILNPSDTCTFLTMKHMAWSPFFGRYKPEFKCPLKKGKYILNNGSFDPSIFRIFPVEYGYWKMNYKIYSAQTLLLEICSEFSLVRSIN
ncbi:hypothetical protein CBL_01898 [Carabus blaptoides fortunei]